MKGSVFSKIVSLVLLGSFLPVVSAHTGELETPRFGWDDYFITLGIITLILALALYGLKRFQSRPGTLPIKKLTIAAGVTLVINAIIIAVVYLEV